MELRPILSALMRSRVALVLLGLQIALTLAIVCNSLFIIGERSALMDRPSGMNEADTVLLSSIGVGAEFDLKASMAEDLAALRALPGVVEAAPINSLPMTNGGWSAGLSLTRDQKTSSAYSAMYFSDEHGLDALGARLVAGRAFRPEEIGTRNRQTAGWPAAIIITRALGQKLWPGEDAVGKAVLLDPDADPSTVVGVVDRLQAPWVHNDAIIEFSTLLPEVIIEGAFTRYVVRSSPGQRDAVLKAAEAKLIAINPNRIVREGKTVMKIRADAYAGDRAMMIILGVVIAALLTITALGIVGMASFWVTQRTKQIGTRRALGATRGAILRYFLAENFVITSIGLLVGAALAYGFNIWLIQHYQTDAMPWYYVPVGCLCLWSLGQLAVLGPARRASRVPPAMATRSI